jgi:hypothetical protein
MSILHEDLYTFLIISCSILLRMKNVSDKSCRENQKTQCMFNNTFSKIVAVSHTYSKVWVSVQKYLCMHTLTENY